MGKTKFTFIDLFAGIGGFRVALEDLGGKCVGFSEIYQPAIKVYKDNFDTDDDIAIGDITKPSYSPYADILVGGVPCQSWSIAGKNKGFEDPRGKLWLDTIKFTEQVKPKAFIYENVKGLADPRNKPNLDLIIKEFTGLGYTVVHKVLNAFDFGLAQSRERIFIVGIRNDLNHSAFEYPKSYGLLPNLSSILDNMIVKTKQKESLAEYKNSFNMAAVANKGNFFIFADVRNGDYTIHSWDLVETTPMEKEICLKILQNRRRPLYGSKDGNPMSFKHIQGLFSINVLALNDRKASSVKKSDLDDLVKKKILRYQDGKYELTHSRISSGINGIYRIFLPESHVFSTLTRSGTRDFIATESIPEEVMNKKAYFIENIYRKKKYRPISAKEAAKIQGFKDDFIFNTPYSTTMGLLGNSIAINIVREVSKKLLTAIEVS